MATVSNHWLATGEPPTNQLPRLTGGLDGPAIGAIAGADLRFGDS